MLSSTPLQSTILDSISDAFFAVDRDWRFTYVNPAAVPLLRHYSDELLCRSIWDVFVGMVGTDFETHFRRALGENVDVAFESYYKPFDTWFRVRAYPTLDGGIAVYLQNISAEKRAEADRRRLEALTAALPDAIIGVTLDGSITDWNAGAERLYGYTTREVVGRTINVLVPTDQRCQLANILEGVQRGEQVARIACPAVAKNGLEVDAVLSVSPVRNDAGEVAGAAIVARELLDDALVDAPLRLLAVALEASANAVVITNTEGSIQWVNAAFTKLTGYSLDEVRGRNPRLLKSGRHDRAFYQVLWQTILMGEVFRGDMVNRRKDGTFYMEHMTITPVRSPQGVVSHFIAVKEEMNSSEYHVHERDRTSPTPENELHR